MVAIKGIALLIASLASHVSAATHLVLVGPNGAHDYQPNVTYAAVGDVVSFLFYPSNHSVIRGEYTDTKACGPSGCNPCVPWGLVHPDQSDIGFGSRNVLTQRYDPNNPGLTYNITIRNLDPIWFYCTALGSCAGNGMVGAINPANGTSIAKQSAAAKKSKIQLNVGQSWPIEGAEVGSEEASMTGMATGSNANNTNGTTSPGNEKKSLSGGAIAGIAIGGVAVVVLAAGLFYFVGRTNTYKEMLKQRSDGVPSQIGDGSGPAGPWSPAMQTPSQGHGWTNNSDPRYSQQPGGFPVSQPPMGEQGPGTFIGYNRSTGAPEFAQEVPTPADKSASPPQFGHPAFGGQQETTYELAAQPDHTQQSPGISPPQITVTPQTPLEKR